MILHIQYELCTIMRVSAALDAVSLIPGTSNGLRHSRLWFANVSGCEHGVRRGFAGEMRHPVYLGALLIWGGLSLCFLSYIAAAITALYVIPAYLLYIHSEEEMMLDTFGDQYRCYCRRIPMLLPRLRIRG